MASYESPRSIVEIAHVPEHFFLTLPVAPDRPLLKAPLRLIGVPEHFSLPATRAIPACAAAGVRVAWASVPGGTGAMVSALLEGEADVAIALTEGALAAAVGNDALRYAGAFVTSPLRWMVAASACGSAGSVAELGRAALECGGCVRVAVSRLGSGSHLMALLLARQEGWPLSRVEFVVRGNFTSMAAAVAEGEGDFLMWEWFMTLPHTIGGGGGGTPLLRAIGHFDSPWQCFGFLARAAWLDDVHNRADLTSAARLMLEEAACFVRSGEEGGDTCAALAKEFSLTIADAAAWLRAVAYAHPQGGLRASAPMLRNALEALASVGAVPVGCAQDEALLSRIVDTRVCALDAQ